MTRSIQENIRGDAIKQRLFTAAVALPLLILLIIKGSFLLFSLFIAIVSMIGLHEYYRMTMPQKGLANIVMSLAGAMLPLLFYLRSPALTVLALTVVTLAVACYSLFTFKDIRAAVTETALQLFGILYIPCLLGYLVLLRSHPAGWQWIMLIILIVMSGDSAAYFVGCSFGRRKLYPEVSPNKSVEGAAGGIAGSIAGVILARLIFFPEIGLFEAVAAAVIIGAFSQVGDLFESLLKRSCGVKDSGTIFPGHGGILDRLDSILFAAPVAYYYSLFIAGRLLT